MKRTLLQVHCEPDSSYYGGGVALRVDAYKQDGSWMRLQAVQTPLPLSAVSVQTSAEAVVESTVVLPQLSLRVYRDARLSVQAHRGIQAVGLKTMTQSDPGLVFRWLHKRGLSDVVPERRCQASPRSRQSP